MIARYRKCERKSPSKGCRNARRTSSYSQRSLISSAQQGAWPMVPRHRNYSRKIWQRRTSKCSQNLVILFAQPNLGPTMRCVIDDSALSQTRKKISQQGMTKRSQNFVIFSAKPNLEPTTRCIVDRTAHYRKYEKKSRQKECRDARKIPSSASRSLISRPQRGAWPMVPRHRNYSRKNLATTNIGRLPKFGHFVRVA